jgi:hypothetical protein
MSPPDKIKQPQREALEKIEWEEKPIPRNYEMQSLKKQSPGTLRQLHYVKLRSEKLLLTNWLHG